MSWPAHGTSPDGQHQLSQADPAAFDFFSLIAVLAVFLFAIGVLLNRIADNLDDCLGNVKKVAGQAELIIPGVGRINQTGGVVTGALPLLIEGAEGIAAKVASPKEVPRYAAPAAVSGRCKLLR